MQQKQDLKKYLLSQRSYLYEQNGNMFVINKFIYIYEDSVKTKKEKKMSSESDLFLE